MVGTILGLINLLPVIPLDGGSITSSALDRLAPGRGRDWTLWWSVAVSAVTAVVLLATDDLQILALFFVLLGAKMPAILVETSFLSNANEERLLSTDAYQTDVANAIADGVNGFLEERSKLAQVD